ncbi:hypothetical protein PQX77_018239 [Marasmius sp. AFHP31]|nr:hypothetical protein PQX77_018239 [Marasmius sp. AFHP31]
MPSAGQHPPQHRQNVNAGFCSAPARSGAFPRAATYSGHPYSPYPTTGVVGIPGDNQSRPLVLGIDITVADVEGQLRRLYNISPNRPVDLYAIPDPPGPSFTQISITQFAIWSSEERKLTQAQIWSRIEQRFQSVRDPETAKKWKANIRHLLSLKKTFVKSSEMRNGVHYWSLDYRYLESGGDKRVRRRGAKKTRNPSDAGKQQRDDDDGDESYDTEEHQSDPFSTKEESSSPSPPSSYTGRRPSAHYDRAYGSHTQSPSNLSFSPSHDTTLSGPPFEQYPSPALYDPNRQPYHHQTYGPPSHSPVFGQNSFIRPNYQSSSFGHYQ